MMFPTKPGQVVTGVGEDILSAIIGLPIEEIPDDWKDGRKVLVYGPAEYHNGSKGCGEWRVGFFSEYWDCYETHVNKLEPTHFLPYPADPV